MYCNTVSALTNGQLIVTKYQLQSLFCYNCWYFIYVNASVGGSNYDIIMQSQPDAGDSLQILSNNVALPLTLAATGSTVTVKFILDSKDSFNVQCLLATGYVNIYIGLYPDAPLTTPAWTGAGGIGTITVNVNTYDQNFYLGVYYYVTVQAT